MPSNKDYNPSVHLSVQDIATNDSKHPSVLHLTVKQSKMDPFRKGVDLIVGKTGSSLCQVAAVLSYLCVRGMSDGPLFKFADGRVLIRQCFVSAVREGLDKAAVATVFESGQLWQLLLEKLKIASSRLWEDERAWPTYNM